MHFLRHSESVASEIARQLTSKMDFKCFKQQCERTRGANIKMTSADYTKFIFDKMNQISCLKPQKRLQTARPQRDLQKVDGHGLGRKPSILKSRKNSSVVDKTSKNFKKKRNLNRNSKNFASQLIKLKSEQQECIALNEFVDKIRVKKIKYDQAMQQFTDGPDYKIKSNKKLTQITLSDKSKNVQNEKQKIFVTDYDGEKIKIEKIQTVKKDNLFMQKLKVKPLFKLKQLIANKQINQNINSEIKNRNNTCESKQNEPVTSEECCIQSIANAISGRKEMQSRRKRKMGVEQVMCV